NYPEIQVLGIHDSQEDQNRLTVIEKNGLKLALLNYTYGTNGIALPGDMPFGVDYLLEEAVIEDLAEAEEIADFTIVCPHWGTEYRLTPDSYQEKWTGIFVDNGADLILGTHPHVIEPVEWKEQNGNKALVYYSLGNFVNWTSGEGAGVSNRMVGLMAKVTLTKQSSGKVEIEDYDAIPLVCHVGSGFGNVTVYPLDAYSEDLASQNAIRTQAPDFSYEYVCHLLDEVLGE
ncbi:MAG: CapA family protein, partial [Clostridiales bacterium]|nr:CapA family protein [Clostridiales bacterium]